MNRLMGIDYGIKRIGVAVSDPLGITAQPLVIVQNQSISKSISEIASLIQKYEVSLVVIGLPLNMDGSEGILTEEVRHFALKIEEQLKIKVEFYDERLTSMQAERILVEEADMSRGKRKILKDKIAASMILQSYLDQQK